jgi:hypothetical protein
MATNSPSAMGNREKMPLWIRDDTTARRGSRIARDGKSACLAQGATMAMLSLKQCAALLNV